ncbi:MAG: hypothetical protein G8237_02520 [Magnetococcales bacterium]|nr:hypothetical protein [Magnetococcales bacterium]
MSLTLEQHRALRDAVHNFNHAMELRTHLNLRVASRVTTLLRIGTISLAGVAIIFLILLVVLTSKIKYMTDLIDTMNTQFTSISKDMGEMRNIIVRMDQAMTTMPVIVQEVETMQESVSSMHSHISSMGERMQSIDKGLTNITNNVTNMTMTFRMMDGSVNQIGHDVHRMSRPMRMFNSIFPFP